MISLYRRQFLYSLALIIIIPGLFLANLAWHTYSFNKTLNKELQRKAVVVAEALGSNIVEHIAEPDQLNRIIRAIPTNEPLMREVTVYRQQGQNFVVAATTNSEKELQVLNDISSNLAWNQQQSVATLEAYGSSGERVWSVITPLKDGANKNVALLVSKLSVADIDTLVNNGLTQSLILLFVTLIVIIALLLNHFHFVGYARLFRNLEQLGYLKKSFIAQTTSDLEQPINAIKNRVGVLEKDYARTLDKKVQAVLHEIHENSEQLGRTLEDLLEFGQVEQSAETIVMQTLNPMAFEATFNQLKEEVAAAGGALTLEIPNPQALITTDSDHLQQVLFALTRTVIDHQDSPNITIGYGPLAKKRWAITLATSPFEIADDQSETTNQQSTPTGTVEQQFGIRYWLAQQIVERMGGKLKTKYEPSQSLSFQIIFPMVRLVEYPKSADAVSGDGSLPASASAIEIDVS